MDYKEAYEKVQVLANGRHNTVGYLVTTDDFGRRTQECKVYIAGPGHFTADTWERVLGMVTSGNRDPVVDIPSIPELEESG